MGRLVEGKLDERSLKNHFLMVAAKTAA